MHLIFSDGGSRGNPGKAAAAYVIFSEEGMLDSFDSKYLGDEVTNNMAEYEGLLMGLKAALKAGLKEVKFYMDSELIIMQVNGAYRVKQAQLKEKWEEVKALKDEFDSIKFIHVRREKQARRQTGKYSVGFQRCWLEFASLWRGCYILENNIYYHLHMFSTVEVDYELDSLEPYIGMDTMETHFTKHYAGYTSKLNAALEGHDDLQDMSIEDLLSDIESLPEDIREAVQNSGGGHYNHSIFFSTLSDEAAVEPDGGLMESIEDSFGSLEDLQAEFNAAAKAVFGSGWAWLVQNSEGDLEVVSTPNQDNPIMNGDYNVLMGLDVWEHAYYLDYQNKRAEYVEAFWHVLDWAKVSERFNS